MTKKKAPETAALEPEVQEIPLALAEFCMRQSRIKNSCLISVFYRMETDQGRLKDTQSAYAKRYAELASTPVK